MGLTHSDIALTEEKGREESGVLQELGLFKSCTWRCYFKKICYIELLQMGVKKKKNSSVSGWMMSNALISLFRHMVSHSVWGFLACDTFPSEVGAHVPGGISALVCVSSGSDGDVMFCPEGNLEWMLSSLSFFLNSLSWRLWKKICFLSKGLMKRRKIMSNKILCSKLTESLYLACCLSQKHFCNHHLWSSQW